MLGGGLAALLAPLGSFAEWTALAAGLCVVATLAQRSTPALTGNPPATRGALRWLANAHQAGAIVLIGVGIRAIDRWWETAPEARTWVWLALCALGALGYLSVRLGMTARFLRPRP